MCDQVPSLSEFLADKQHQHMVIGELPASLRRCLLHGRNFIQKLHLQSLYLARLGLLSFGKSESRIKEEVSLLITTVLTYCFGFGL